MKLSDIDKNLNEAPVNFLKRAATKLKKHTPFAPGVRAQAEGRDKIEAAANAVNIAFRNWVGKNNKVTINVIPHKELIKFFELINMGKTANEVISRIPQVKKISQSNSATESFETRLAKMLNEVEVDQTDGNNPVVFFNKKDAEKIILDVVSEIESENPDGLGDWLASKGVKQDQASPAPAEQPKEPAPAEQPKGQEAANVEQLEAMWDQMVQSLQMDDTSAQIMKAAFDNARKKVLSGEVGEFNSK
jgi:hypothetical protein